MQVIVDGLVTTYQKKGTGRLVLLLHGWGDSSKGFAELADLLSKKYAVVSLDLPGFGDSESPKTVWNLDAYAEFTAHFLQKVDSDRVYAIIGHSNGGAIAIKAIAKATIHTNKLILLAAAGIRPKQTARRVTFTVLAKTGNLATLWMPENYRRALRKSLYTAAGSDMLVVPELEETFKKTVRQDIQSDAATITVPTLLVFAVNDEAVPKLSGETFHRLIKNSKLVIVKDAGHFVHLEKPVEVSKQILEFLQ